MLAAERRMLLVWHEIGVVQTDSSRSHTKPTSRKLTHRIRGILRIRTGRVSSSQISVTMSQPFLLGTRSLKPKLTASSNCGLQRPDPIHTDQVLH